MFTKALALALAFATAALAAPLHDHNHKVPTVCSSDRSNPINIDNLDSALNAYHSAFGGGAGTLNAGYGGSPTYQGVCCSGWCLWVELGTSSARSWSDDQFNTALDVIKGQGSSPMGSGGCGTNLDGDDLYLYYQPQDWQIYVKEGSNDIQRQRVGDVFGDTCIGMPGYNGPHA